MGSFSIVHLFILAVILLVPPLVAVALIVQLRRSRRL